MFVTRLQGRPDYALASAGGRVVGHSLLAAEGRPRWAPLLQRAARLAPGGLLHFVHPRADEVPLSRRQTILAVWCRPALSGWCAGPRGRHLAALCGAPATQGGWHGCRGAPYGLLAVTPQAWG